MGNDSGFCCDHAADFPLASLSQKYASNRQAVQQQKAILQQKMHKPLVLQENSPLKYTDLANQSRQKIQVRKKLVQSQVLNETNSESFPFTQLQKQQKQARKSQIKKTKLNTQTSRHSFKRTDYKQQQKIYKKRQSLANHCKVCKQVATTRSNKLHDFEFVVNYYR